MSPDTSGPTISVSHRRCQPCHIFLSILYIAKSEYSVDVWSHTHVLLFFIPTRPLTAGSSQIQSLPSSYPALLFKNTSPLGLPEENPRDNCIIQTTEWSECSASCGMGVSFRITNNNQHCQMERQTRICMLRPCNSQQEKEIKVCVSVQVLNNSSQVVCIHVCL